MKGLLHRFFLQHWQRKAISAALAAFIWLAVNHSLTSTRTISNVPVRIVNVPAGKTVEGLNSNGFLSKKMALSLVGNKATLDDLAATDLEVVIDASNKGEEWIASINKSNLISLNPDIDIGKGISRISHQSFIIRTAKLVTEKIPVLITRPIGEPPRDYQFVDIWPYQLNLTVAGPEELVKQLKTKGVKLTFNLHQIAKNQLDDLAVTRTGGHGDVVSYYVPDLWKQVTLPLLSDTPIEINDPQAKNLRIDFVRSNLLPIEKPIPISLFVPPHCMRLINPKAVALSPCGLLENAEGFTFFSSRIYAKGVSAPFLKIVRDMLEIVVIVVPKAEKAKLEWSLQFINPSVLEDRYVSLLMSDASDDEIRDLEPALREEYLRNRFRNYMNRLQLCWADETPLDLNIELKGENVLIHQVSQEQ